MNRRALVGIVVLPGIFWNVPDVANERRPLATESSFPLNPVSVGIPYPADTIDWREAARMGVVWMGWIGKRGSDPMSGGLSAFQFDADLFVHHHDDRRQVALEDRGSNGNHFGCRFSQVDYQKSDDDRRLIEGLEKSHSDAWAMGREKFGAPERDGIFQLEALPTSYYRQEASEADQPKGKIGYRVVAPIGPAFRIIIPLIFVSALLGGAIFLWGLARVSDGQYRSGWAAMILGAYLASSGPLSLSFGWLPLSQLWRSIG